MSNVLIVTDSLGLPRPQENIFLEDTWIYKIMQKYPQYMYFTFLKHGMKSTIFKEQGELFSFNPEIVIIQVGIVDCVRRALSLRQLRMLSKIPFINRRIQHFCNKNHYKMTKLRKIQYVDIDDFDINIENAMERIFSNEKNPLVIFIAIAPPNCKQEETTYKVIQDISEYNDIIKKRIEKYKNVFFLNPYDGEDPEQILLNDGHHINIYGHNVVLKSIDKVLSQLT